MVRKCMIVDIDKTVANCEHREHHLSGTIKDWDKFFSECGFDKPIQQNVDAVHNLYYLFKTKWPDLKLIFLTGRPTRVKGVTHVWLANHFDFSFDLITRHDDLWILNHEFKKMAVEELCQSFTPVLYLDDDHESCKAVKPFIKDGYVLTVV